MYLPVLMLICDKLLFCQPTHCRSWTLLHDDLHRDVTGACELCLSSTNRCVIHLVTKGKSTKVTLEKSKCYNLPKQFELGHTAKFTAAYLVPITCFSVSSVPTMEVLAVPPLFLQESGHSGGMKFSRGPC